MSLFTIGWIVWALGFAVLEGVALVNKRKGDTLSEHVWKYFDVDTKRWTFLRFVLTAGMVWLTGHFVFRLWAG